jgi:hypothetical protein
MVCILAIVVGWLVSGVFSWGIAFAYFQREYPLLAQEDYRRDLRMCALGSMLGGPASLMSSLTTSRFCKHGFKLF